MQAISPSDWEEYQLLDCGYGEKLEKFGQYIVIRPEPQALWPPQWKLEKWREMAHIRFVRENPNKPTANSKEPLGWAYLKKNVNTPWWINYKYKDLHLKMKLILTGFGHVGIFPEQADNWNFIYDRVKKIGKPKLLNLFAYTGGASIVGAMAGADVYHLDAIKQVVNWSSENAQGNQIKNIHWVVDDAIKYLKRVVKKGEKFQGLILDPPAYGRGPNGERWVLSEGLDELIQLCAQVLNGQDAFMIVNFYSLGLSPQVGYNMIKAYFKGGSIHYGELYIPSETGYKLPLGNYVRYER